MVVGECFMNEVGNFIHRLRKEKRMSQKELAKKLSVTVQAVSKWETGHGIPDVLLLQPISEQLGVSLTELIKGHRIEKSKIEKEADDLIIDTVIDKNKKIKKIKHLYFIFIILLSVFLLIFTSYKMFCQRLGDVVLITYNDKYFILNDMYLYTTNDYRRHKFFNGNLKIDKSLLKKADRVLVEFCYSKNLCNKLIDSNDNFFRISKEYNFNYVYKNENETQDISVREYENLLYDSFLLVTLFEGSNKNNYKLDLSIDYIYYNHSKLFTYNNK